jgi:hypothetical protein
MPTAIVELPRIQLVAVDAVAKCNGETEAAIGYLMAIPEE